MDVNGKSGKCEMFYSFEFVQKSVEMENYIWLAHDKRQLKS